MAARMPSSDTRLVRRRFANNKNYRRQTPDAMQRAGRSRVAAFQRLKPQHGLGQWEPAASQQPARRPAPSNRLPRVSSHPGVDKWTRGRKRALERGCSSRSCVFMLTLRVCVREKTPPLLAGLRSTPGRRNARSRRRRFPSGSSGVVSRPRQRSVILDRGRGG